MIINICSRNGSSAILEASSHNPDIVLLDLGLPDMEGVEVIKKNSYLVEYADYCDQRQK